MPKGSVFTVEVRPLEGSGAVAFGRFMAIEDRGSQSANAEFAREIARRLGFPNAKITFRLF